MELTVLCKVRDQLNFLKARKDGGLWYMRTAVVREDILIADREHLEKNGFVHNEFRIPGDQMKRLFKYFVDVGINAMETILAESAENWVNAKRYAPTHNFTVVLWVTGGPLHHGEDYLDVGSWIPEDQHFVTEIRGESVAVPVSHWMYPGRPS